MYIALFAQEKNGRYSAVFPDLPGVVVTGRTPQETIRKTKNALVRHIEQLRAAGEPEPKSRSLDDIKAQWKDWAEWEAKANFIPLPVTRFPVPKSPFSKDLPLQKGVSIQSFPMV